MSPTRWPRPASPRASARRRADASCSALSASTVWPTGRRGGCRAASSSGWRWRARSRAIPEVLFLDEPTASLDPAATKAIEDIMRAVAARGVKVVMSTHDLGQARRLAGDIVLLASRPAHRERRRPRAFFAAPRTAEARAFVAGELLV